MNTSTDKQFYITLHSEASPTLYPNNSACHFTNELENPIHLDYAKKWRVCLQYISFGKAISGVINVECSGIDTEHNITSLSTFTLNDNQEYYPEGNEYFDVVSHSVLSQITISLTDKDNKPLTHCASTLLRLKFKSMSRDYYEFQTLRVESPADSNPADFSVSLPSVLNEDGKQNPWDIALTRVNVQPGALVQFPNLPETMTITLMHDMPREEFLQTKEAWAELVHLPENFWFIPRYQHFMGNFSTKPLTEKPVTKQELLDFLNDKILQLRNEKIPLSQMKNLDHRKTKFVNYEGDRTHLSSYFENMGISLPKGLLLALGYTNMWEDVVHKDHGVIGWFESFDNSKSASASQMQVHQEGYKSIMLQTNCVDRSYIGSSSKAFLTTFLMDCSKEYQTIEPKNLEFHQAVNTDFSNVNFKLIDQAHDRPIKLEKPCKTSISLLLRRKKKK